MADSAELKTGGEEKKSASRKGAWANILFLHLFSNPLLSTACFLVVTLAAAGYLLARAAYGGMPTRDLIFGVVLYALFALFWWGARSLSSALGWVHAEVESLKEQNAALEKRAADRTRAMTIALHKAHTAAVRNQMILESMTDGVIVVNSALEVVMANPVAADFVKMPDLLGLNLVDVFHEIAAHDREIIVDLISKPTAANLKFELSDKIIAASLSPISLYEQGKGGDDVGSVIILHDFTGEAKEARNKLAFLGMVSHELRTPLTAIKGYVELVRREELSELICKSLDVVDRNIERLISLTNELIDVSRIETGEIELHGRWLDVAELIESAVNTMQHEFDRRGLKLEVEIDDDLPRLFLDENRIQQVMINLLSNAYKYTPEGKVSVRAHKLDGIVQIEIEDTGIGMNEEEKMHVFERFFRAGNSYVKKAGGTGLGLFISKGLVEMHGGRMTFESQSGRGTVFFVRLPTQPTASVNQHADHEN